jgi:DNA replication protein DnaC
MKKAISCPLCDDTGWKPIEESNVRQVVRCDCWYDQIAEQRLHEARIPPRYKNCTLDNFRTDTDSLIQAVQKCREFVAAFPVVEKGLLFLGAPGVGKTHLATATLREIIKRTNAAGLFFDVRELLRVIRDTYNPVVRTTEFEVIRPVVDAQLLVLDDLGAEKTSEWVDETMTLIISSRYNQRRPTIFTTNYLDRQPDERSPAEVLIERVGFRIHSRLHEMCTFVDMKALDYRRVGDEATPEALDRLEKHGRSISDSGLPSRAKAARAQLRQPVRDTRADLKWPGGRAGS